MLFEEFKKNPSVTSLRVLLEAENVFADQALEVICAIQDGKQQVELLELLASNMPLTLSDFFYAGISQNCWH